MAADDAQDRHLPASPRKLQKARREGQLPRSRDLGHALALGGAWLAAGSLLPAALDAGAALLRRGLRFDALSLGRAEALPEGLGTALGDFLSLVAPVAALMLGLALAAGLGLGGWNWTLQPLAPRFGKLNPLSGLGQLLSADKLIDTGRSVLLALAVMAAGGFYLAAHLEDFRALPARPLPAALEALGGLLHQGLVGAVAVLLLFALIDVPLQRHQHAKRLRMSVQEAKQEHKEQEGSPEVKGRMRALMRQQAQRRMMAAVPTADLVVTNPTHYAVALKYEEAAMGAPRIVALGVDLVAQRIRERAAASGVPVLEAPPLARALWAHGELDREIPVALYAAVAQVLAHVYQLKAALAGQAPAPGPLPELPVPVGLDPQARPAPDSADPTSR